MDHSGATTTNAASLGEARHDDSFEHLNNPDKDVLRLICEGISNKEIACRLGTTVPMIKYRNNRIFASLGVSNRVQAALRAEQCLGLLLNDRSLGAAGPMPERLSAIELSVLTLLSNGSTTQQVGAKLGIRRPTVKWYLATIFGKLQVQNRLQAIARARQMHVL